MENVKKAIIEIKSEINGEIIFKEYQGEYQFENGSHNIAYIDYEGKAVTKTAIETNSEKMLLHRVGAINGDMFFDITTDTVTRYDAFMITEGFIIHTYEYSVAESEGNIRIILHYGLNNGADNEVINGNNKITLFTSDKQRRRPQNGHLLFGYAAYPKSVFITPFHAKLCVNATKKAHNRSCTLKNT